MAELVESIRERYLKVMDRIGTAARAAGREPAEVRLVVVTKGHPLEVAGAAIEAGAKSWERTILKKAQARLKPSTNNLR